jgi:hypothetical protein
MATLTGEDKGKVLIDTEGEGFGVVTDVEDNTAYVDPDPGLGEAVLAALGRADRDDDALVIEGEIIETVSDEEVRLSGDVDV